MFDGVDERQTARALARGALSAEEHGFQYIVTLNSDQIPPQFAREYAIADFELPVKLTDYGEEGGLFGFRF